MCLPNFIIIGAEKAGTTALWQFLRQHPQVYMSAVKEPQFFGYEGREVSFQGPGPVVKEALPICDLEEYKSLFKGTESYKAVGEASPSYLYNSQAPERIRHYVPQAKLIAILRNPVDRAYSRFLHLVREDREPGGGLSGSAGKGTVAYPEQLVARLSSISRTGSTTLNSHATMTFLTRAKSRFICTKT